jgi:GR25 family glycosyltransferase involved in LPS biosynthesis
MKTYIISLNKPDKLINQLNDIGLEPTLFNGVNGKTINLNTIKQHFNPIWFNVGPVAALGCAMSHLSVWKTFLKTKQQFCLILEDDVIFEKDFSKEKIKQVVLDTPTDFDILYLGCFNSPTFVYAMTLLLMNKNTNNTCKSKLVKNTDVALATHAYIISRKGAKKLIKLLDHNINNHIDFCIQRLNKNNLIKSYTLKNKIIHQTSTDGGYAPLRQNENSRIKVPHSTNVINQHPILLQNILSKIYIDKHVTCDYLFTVSFMQIDDFTFNLTSILFLLLGIIFYKNNYTTLSVIFFIGSLPDLLSNNFKSTFLHYLLLISPKLLTFI